MKNFAYISDVITDNEKKIFEHFGVTPDPLSEERHIVSIHGEAGGYLIDIRDYEDFGTPQVRAGRSVGEFFLSNEYVASLQPNPDFNRQ